MLHDEMGQHLEKQHNSLSQYFLNDHYMMLQRYAWAKDPFKVQERPMAFDLKK